MGVIRPLERGDVPAAASLYEHVARSGARTPPPGLVPYFERTFLDHPWADPEIPSLVYVDDDGSIAGFIGSSVRRLILDGRPLRLGVSGQLVTEPGVRNQAAGAFLMREYMKGPQDLTLSDTASETVRRIWEGIGGETAHLHCVGWIRLFRPFEAADELLSRRREPRGIARVRRPLAAAGDILAARLARRTLQAKPPAATAELLDAARVAEHVASVAGSYRLRPAYEDEEFVAWMLDCIAEIDTRGELCARLVRQDGEVRGWYVALVPKGGLAQVLQVAGEERAIGPVLDHLFHEAWALGAVGVQGRVEAHLLAPLSHRKCVFHPSGYLAVVHARDPEILHVIRSGHALLTRLEGDWWNGHHLLPFDDAGEA
jgi:hypothetical protein